MNRLQIHEPAMTKTEAAQAVTRINWLLADSTKAVRRLGNNLAELRELLLALHDQRGWEALGFKSWAACVTAKIEASERTLFNELKAAQFERQFLQPLQFGTISAGKLLLFKDLESDEDRQEVAGQVFAGGNQPTVAQVEQAVLARMSPEMQLNFVQAAAKRSEAASAKVDQRANDVHGEKGADGDAKMYRLGEAILREAKRGRRHYVKWKRVTAKILKRSAQNWRDAQRLLGYDVPDKAVPERTQRRRRAA